MKGNNIFIIAVFLILVASCNKSSLTVAELKVDVNKTLDNWHQAVADANFDKYFSYMSKDAVFIGTDASENWKIADFKIFCKPYFEKKKTWHFTPLQRNVYFDNSKNIAWFDELLKTDMGICRGSGVLTRNKNKWKIKQYVLSLTIPNKNVDSIIKLNKEHDIIFLRKLKNNIK